MIGWLFEHARCAYFRSTRCRELERWSADPDAHELERSQWWTEEQLRAWQGQRLAALLHHATVHTPWFGRLLGGRDVRAADPWDTLAALPVLRRIDLLLHASELVADDAARRGAFTNRTGGSTGERVQFVQDRAYHDRALRQIERGYAWCGFRPGDAHAFLWGSDADSREHAGLATGWCDFWGAHRLWVNVFALRRLALAGVVARLRVLRPRFLFGYVSAVAMLAQVLEELGETGVRPQAVETTAEVLTPDHRARIAHALGCEVFDRYGCREVGNIAHECTAHAGLHVLGESNLVEVLDLTDDRPAVPGTLGRLVVTNLDNFAQPFLRYELGDLGRAVDGPCPCGRRLSRIVVESGRVGDVVEGPSGRLLHTEFFTHLFYAHGGVWQFEVVQVTPSRLQVRVVPGPGYDDAVRRAVTSQILEHGDPGFEVEWQVVAAIPPSPSGKYRFVRREL